MPRCPRCNADNPGGATYCSNCGQGLLAPGAPEAQNTQSQPRGIRSHPTLISFICTAIPILALSLTDAGLANANFWWEWGIAEVLTAIAGVMEGLALVTAIVFSIARKKQIASGIFIGMAIGSIGLMVSCFSYQGS